MTRSMHYKPDDTFRRFLAMAACGEEAAIEWMKQYGHDFAYSDFGSGSIEVSKDESKKRKRKADLMCKKCGQKLEVRAKSRPQIAMSDSASRPFDKELSQDDWVGFWLVKRRVDIIEEEFDSHNPDHYETLGGLYIIKVSELSSKRALLSSPERKDSSQGSESYLEWPTINSPISGNVSDIQRNPDGGKILIKNDSQEEIISVPSGYYRYGGLKIGASVIANQTILCGLAKPMVRKDLICKNL